MASRISSFFKSILPNRHSLVEAQFSQVDAIWMFMMSQHERAGQHSLAHQVRPLHRLSRCSLAHLLPSVPPQLPPCCCRQIAEFAEDAQERVNAVLDDPEALVRLIIQSEKKRVLQRSVKCEWNEQNEL